MQWELDSGEDCLGSCARWQTLRASLASEVAHWMPPVRRGDRVEAAMAHQLPIGRCPRRHPWHMAAALAHSLPLMIRFAGQRRRRLRMQALLRGHIWHSVRAARHLGEACIHPLSQYRGTRKATLDAVCKTFSIPKPHLWKESGPGSLTAVYPSRTLASSSSLGKQEAKCLQSTPVDGTSPGQRPSSRRLNVGSGTSMGTQSNLTHGLYRPATSSSAYGERPRARVDDAMANLLRPIELRRYGAALMPRRAAVRERWRTPEVGSEKKMKLERDERSWAGCQQMPCRFIRQ